MGQRLDLREKGLHQGASSSRRQATPAGKGQRLIDAAMAPHGWLVAAMLAVGALMHYSHLLPLLEDIAARSPVGQTSLHSMERVIFLLPVGYAAFAFGFLGGVLTLMVATAIMVPMALMMPAGRVDALFEIAGVLVVSGLVSLWFDAQERERRRRQDALLKLEEARRELADHVEAIRANERRLATINEVCRAITHSQNLPQGLQWILEHIAAAMQVSAALLFLRDEERAELVLTAHHGVSKDLAQRLTHLKVGEGVNGRVAETGEPVVMDDAFSDPRLAPAEAAQGETASLVAVPLKAKEVVTGTLCLAQGQPRHFRKGEVEILTALGSQMGIAIENSRLYRDLHTSEGRYRDLFENASVAIFIHDLDGVVVAANKACAALTGYSLLELRGYSADRLYRPETLRVLKDAEAAMLKGGRPVPTMELPMLRKNGSEVIVSVTTRLIAEEEQATGFEHIAVDVTERRRMQENLSYYVRQTITAQEDERKRIARELHDETAQSMVLLSQRLDRLTTDWGHNLPSDIVDQLHGLRSLVVATLSDLRRLTQDLRPRILDDLGLVPALEWLTDDMERQRGIAATVEVSGTRRELGPEVQLLLFRIAQEALRNVWRHSGASTVTVRLAFEDSKTRVTVSDNGHGFQVPSDLGELASTGKLGLLGMHERARLLGGAVQVQSSPGKGTTVEVELPTP